MRPVRSAVLLALTLAACTSDTLDNTAYRRLVDPFDSPDQCLAEGNFARCYDTLTFCPDGTVNATLASREQGHYTVENDAAIAQLPTVTVIFDLQHATSEQLPGRHDWEHVMPLQYDCGAQ